MICRQQWSRRGPIAEQDIGGSGQEVGAVAEPEIKFTTATWSPKFSGFCPRDICSTTPAFCHPCRHLVDLVYDDRVLVDDGHGRPAPVDRGLLVDLADHSPPHPPVVLR
ncbi:hypothetical protein DVH24_042475 [Malus domestica]|uniref:Uncharacterized protein n=1 Tax=Malus domestica TaxID=3750 RepID=A0A498HK03_MALDO|nr:hypothetical protein DVH24_031495 [Malus domestica]RXH69717.1 hypothetical protein DVH24_042475 [Malus domestica]